MNIEPLPKKIYNELLSAGITTLKLYFSGGSDEGYLEVFLEPCDTPHKTACLEEAIDTWAWEVYSYSGAGEGNSYGDDITYNLKEMTAECSSWCMTRTEDGCEHDSFELCDDVGEEEL